MILMYNNTYTEGFFTPYTHWARSLLGRYQTYFNAQFGKICHEILFQCLKITSLYK